MYMSTYVCVRACDVQLAGCIALFFSVSLFYSVDDVRRGEGGVKICSFAFLRFVLLWVFVSLVVRTAELDGGCMRLSRDHM